MNGLKDLLQNLGNLLANGGAAPVPRGPSPANLIPQPSGYNDINSRRTPQKVSGQSAQMKVQAPPPKQIQIAPTNPLQGLQNLLAPILSGLQHGGADVQKFIQSPAQTKVLPEFKQNKKDNMAVGAAKTIANIPSQIGNSIVGQGVIDPALDFGREIGSVVTGQPLPQYQDLKSPVTRLGYELGGLFNGDSQKQLNIKTNAQQVVGNVAGTAMPVINAATLGPGKKIVEGAAGKLPLKELMKQGAKQGAGYGALFGGGQALESGRDMPTFKDDAINAAVQAVLGAGTGAVIGAAVPAATRGVKNATTYIDKLQKENGSQGGYAGFGGESGLSPEEYIVKKYKQVGKAGMEPDEWAALKQMSSNDLRDIAGGKPLGTNSAADNAAIAKNPKATAADVQEASQRSTGKGFLADYDNAVNSKNWEEAANIVNNVIDAKPGTEQARYKNSIVQHFSQYIAPIVEDQQSGRVDNLRAAVPLLSEEMKHGNGNSVIQFLHNEQGGGDPSAEISNPFSKGKTENVDFYKQPGTDVLNDVKGAIRGADVKERGFITSVKESPNTPNPLKELVSGSYVPKSNKQLEHDALALIRHDPAAAEQIALNPRSDTDVQVGNMLLRHYAETGNLEQANKIASGMANSGTDFGRAVQAFSMYDKTTPEGALRFAQSKVNEYNRIHPNAKLSVTDAQVKGLFDQAHAVQKMPEGRERNIAANELMNQVNNLIPSSIADKAVTVWKAGLLTSLRTHERNLIGNTIHQGAEIVKDLPATAADMIMSLKTGKRTLTPTVKGLGSGAKKGFGQARDLATMGYDPEEAISKYDARHVTWGNNPVEQVLKKYTDIVFRTLGAEDKPFWNAAFARSLYDQAGAQAINAGKRGDGAFIESLVKSPKEEMLIAAAKDANVATFHDATTISRIASAVKQSIGPAGEIIAPFTGVPSSVATQVVRYSPIGLIKGIAHAGQVMAKDVPDLQRAAAQEIGRGVIGTGLLGVGAFLAQQGLITGQPKDLKESQQWQLENKQPNSVLIGGKWRSIGSIGPENLVILAGAKAQNELTSGDGSLSRFGASVGKDYLAQTFLQGVQQPLAAITDPVRYGPSVSGNLASSVIPNIVKDTSKALDPYVRENNNVGDYVTNAIPGLRNQNIVKRDNLGNPIPQEPTGVGAYVDLFNSKTPISNPVVDELARLNNMGLNATPSKLDKSQTIQGQKMKLTPEQLDVFESQAGPQTFQAIQQLISSPQYQSLSDEEKQNAIGDVVASARKRSRATADLNSPVGAEQLQNPQSTSNAYQVVNPETGAVRSISLGRTIKRPVLTGNSALDSKLTTAYRSQVNGAINDVVAVYNDGQISAQEASKQIMALQGLLGAKKGKKAKTFKAPKIKAASSSRKNTTFKGGGTTPFKFAKSSRLQLSGNTIKIKKSSNPALKLAKFKLPKMTVSRAVRIQNPTV